MTRDVLKQDNPQWPVCNVVYVNDKYTWNRDVNYNSKSQQKFHTEHNFPSDEEIFIY